MLNMNIFANLIVALNIGIVATLDPRCDSHGGCQVSEALFNNYSNSFRPVYDLNKQLIVNISPTLSWLTMVDEVNQQITYKEWLPMLWFDEYLTWNTSDFNGIQTFSVQATKLWLPNIEPLNANQIKYIIPKEETFAQIESNGLVSVAFVKEVTFRCEFNFDNFPFDRQICHIEYGSDITFEDLKLNDFNPVHQTRILSNHPEWKLIRTMENPVRIPFQFEYVNGNRRPFEMLRYSIEIERYPDFYIHTMVIPSFLATMLTFVAFFMPDVENGSTLSTVTYALTIMLTLSVMLQMVTSSIARNAQSLPLLAWFILGEFVISIIASFCSTLIVFCHEKATVYQWEFCRHYKTSPNKQTDKEDNIELEHHALRKRHKKPDLESIHQVIEDFHRISSFVENWLDQNDSAAAEAEANVLFWVKIIDWINIVCFVLFSVVNIIFLLVFIPYFF